MFWVWRGLGRELKGRRELGSDKSVSGSSSESARTAGRTEVGGNNGFVFGWSCEGGAGWGGSDVISLLELRFMRSSLASSCFEVR